MSNTNNHVQEKFITGHKTGGLVLFLVIVRRCGHDHEIGIPVGASSVGRRGEVQISVREVVFDLLIDDRRLFIVDHLHLFRQHVDSRHLIML